MKISVIILSVLLILSCSGERMIKKHESGRDFNDTAKNREAAVTLENGKTFAVENILYERGRFYYGENRKDTLAYDSVKCVSFYKTHLLGTGIKYALLTIGSGIILGGVAEGIEGRDEIPAYFMYIAGAGLVASPIGFLVGYLNGQNITYEMKHRK